MKRNKKVIITLVSIVFIMALLVTSATGCRRARASATFSARKACFEYRITDVDGVRAVFITDASNPANPLDNIQQLWGDPWDDGVRAAYRRNIGSRSPGPPPTLNYWEWNYQPGSVNSLTLKICKRDPARVLDIRIDVQDNNLNVTTYFYRDRIRTAPIVPPGPPASQVNWLKDTNCYEVAVSGRGGISQVDIEDLTNGNIEQTFGDRWYEATSRSNFLTRPIVRGNLNRLSFAGFRAAPPTATVKVCVVDPTLSGQLRITVTSVSGRTASVVISTP